ncbi:MAG: hypothetical protein AABX51_00985 [Nanoarchaeota archaeon]
MRLLGLLLFIVLFTAACKIQPQQPEIPVVPPSNEIIETPPEVVEEPGQTFDPRCPKSCDDNNKCTQDICNQQTSFECRTIPIVPCCGNGICEYGESTEVCVDDCSQESSEFKKLIVNSARAESYSYRYEYSEGDTLKDTYVAKYAGPYTLLELDDLAHKNTFYYNRVFVNKTSGTAILYCLKSCGPNTLAMKTQSIEEFVQKKPVEFLHSLTSVVVTGKENIEGKEAAILIKKNDDGTTLKLRVWEFFGVPMVIELVASDNTVLTRTRYRNLIVNGITESEIQPPKDLVFS